MLHHQGEQATHLAIVAKKDLTLTVLHILLNVKGDGLRHAEIFHCFGHSHAQFSAQSEEVINSVARSEYNSRMIKDSHLLCTELLGAQAFHFDKLLKVYRYIILARNVKIGRFVRCRFRLRNENLIYFQGLVVLYQLSNIFANTLPIKSRGIISRVQR